MNRLDFKTISDDYGFQLIRNLGEDEVRQAIWDFVSFKNFGLDGAIFNFIKEFWEDDVSIFLNFLH